VVLTLLTLVGGIALLAYAADQFVIGAARVALLRRIPTLAVGVVIIGFGTSAPELLVSSLAAAGDKPEIAVGNIIGSNIANLSLLLGFGAVLVSMRVASGTVRREGLMTLGAMIAFALAVRGGGISRIEGLALLVLLAIALIVVMRASPGDPLGSETADLVSPEGHRLGVEVVRTLLGLVGTIASAQLLLWAAVDLAARAGVSEGFVGVTLVAVGTSLPELVTVIQSARRRQTDLIIGNLLGSNLFNALGVGGVIGLVGTSGIDAPQLTTIAALAAVGVAALAVGAMRTGRGVSRLEGIVLVAIYVAVIPFLA
jgi:cation:H+ antiporter